MRRRVLIVVENLPVPFDGRVWKEACALRDAGYRVSVLSPRTKSYRKRHEILEGIHIYRHPMFAEANSPAGYVCEYAFSLFWEFLYAWWIFFQRGFHVIQGCNPPDDIFLIALPFQLFGVKYIFDHHDATPELYLSKYGKKNLLYKFQAWLERATYSASDVVIATNESYRKLAVNRGGVDPRNVFVVRNGPDLDRFKLVPEQPSLKWGKRHLVGYVGTMSSQEGLDILIETAARIREQGRTDVHFTCVGGGPALPALRELVRKKQLENMLNFTGRIPDHDLLEILSTADVCVNPDRPCEMNNISTMIKIAEYMALGKPIVQFDLKEGRFTAEGASLYCDNEDQVNDFANKIVWLLDHPEERQKMGEIGRRRVEEQLAWKYSAGHLLAAYERAFSAGEGARVGQASSSSASAAER